MVTSNRDRAPEQMAGCGLLVRAPDRTSPFGRRGGDNHCSHCSIITLYSFCLAARPPPPHTHTHTRSCSLSIGFVFCDTQSDSHALNSIWFTLIILADSRPSGISGRRSRCFPPGRRLIHHRGATPRTHGANVGIVPLQIVTRSSPGASHSLTYIVP